MHSKLGLPQDRPLFRVANALPPPPCGSNARSMNPGLYTTDRLQDIHEGLPPSGISGGSLHLVQGSYKYYHYMQVH